MVKCKKAGQLISQDLPPAKPYEFVCKGICLCRKEAYDLSKCNHRVLLYWSSGVIFVV